MSNRVPPPPLDLSAAAWMNETPDDFARRIEQVSPNIRKSRKEVTAEALIEWNQQISPVAAKEAVLKAVFDDESNSVARVAKTPKIKDEEAPLDSNAFMVDEQSPGIEAKGISPCVSDFGVEAVVSGEQRSAFDELSGANFWNDGDSGSERNEFIHENDTEADVAYASKSMDSCSVGGFTGDSACDIAYHVAGSITESNKSQYQNREPNITHEDCRECINMKEDMIQERKLTEEKMVLERTHMEEQMVQERMQMEEQMSRERVQMEEQIDQERMRMEETLASLKKTIAVLEAQSIAFTDKAAAYADACMNTETNDGQESDMASPKSLSSPPPPSPSPSQLGLSSVPSHPAQTPVAQILGPCLALSHECQSTSPMEIPYPFLDFIKSTIFRIVSLLCCLVNFALSVRMHREKEIWIQANSLTRKHFLEHPSAEFSIWGLLFIIGSLAVIS